MLSFPEAQADWVRPGLLLYGVSPFAGTIGADYGLQPAMTLHSHVIAVKDLAAGEHVGYGGDWTAGRPTRLAVAAVGYGDGYPRSLASGSPVLVNGERAPLAGRVSMDMIGIDVTGLKRPPQLGDPVDSVGRGIAGGGDCGMGKHHPVRAAVRHQPARGRDAALRLCVICVAVSAADVQRLMFSDPMRPRATPCSHASPTAIDRSSGEMRA